MNKDSVTDRQSIAVIVMYITGTSSLVIFALQAKKDLWIGILICYLMTVLMSLMIGRIKYLFPDVDIFQIFEICFGKILSKVINTVYIISAFYIVVLINTFLIHFIRATALPNTPKFVLGIDLASDFYYPTYLAASRIMISKYFHGLELILSIVFILGSFVKTNVYFLVCCKAVARSFGFQDNYRFIVTPIGLLIFCASLFFYEGTLDYTQWLKINLVPYSIPYIIIIPVITFIVAEFKKKKV